MGKFAKAETQAASVIRALQRQGDLKSFSTAETYNQALIRVCRYMKGERLGSLRDLTVENAMNYLDLRSEEVGQKTLDQDRHAIQFMMQHLTKKIAVSERLACVKSDTPQILASRSYTTEQVSMITNAQRGANELATQIAYAAGLRGHELLSLRPIGEREPSLTTKNPLTTKFKGRDGERYTVKGKGGLIREIVLPKVLATQLESLRLNTPQRVTDRGIHYQQNYKINGGKNWASSFSKASQRALGWTSGAHGLRHSYAQERMHQLQHSGLARIDALATVSQEMGHFRPYITETYLR